MRHRSPPLGPGADPGATNHTENGVSEPDTDPKKDPNKKHRHDYGAVDHGAISAEETTRSIQVILGICIVSSIALLLYSVVQMASG